MFTGIIQGIGKVKKIQKKYGGLNVAIECPFRVAKKLKVGSSISVSGVCSTVVERANNWFEVYLMPETLKVTILGALKVGGKVNLEPSLRVGDELAGHFVLGHIDGVCRVHKVSKVKNFKVLEFRIPSKLMRYIIRKGSVTIDGVSLTVVTSNQRRSRFTVAFIPYTLEHTIWGSKKEGDKANIEVDMLVKVALQNRI